MHRTFASVDALPLLCRAGGRGGVRRGRWLAAHLSAPSQVTAAALLCGAPWVVVQLQLWARIQGLQNPGFRSLCCKTPVSDLICIKTPVSNLHV